MNPRIVPYISVQNASDAIGFYENAFGEYISARRFAILLGGSFTQKSRSVPRLS